ncbi:MAG: GNAT family N-acetyltransferase [Thermoleophilia bacterium]
MEIELQPFTAGDYDRLIGWVSSPEALLQWAGDAFTYPLTALQLDQHLAALQCGRRRIYKALDRANGEVIGHIELNGIDMSQRQARITRLLVGDVARRGQGIDSEIVLAMLRVGFDELDLQRIELFVFEFNVVAIRLYEQLGFVREGSLVEFYSRGDSFWNVYVLAMLQDSWRARYGAHHPA